MPASGFIDACGFNPASGGTGSFVVAAAITGYQTPASAGATNGTIYAYRAQSLDMSQWEIGFGTYSSATPTLARTTVTANSSGGTSAINFSAAPSVFVTALSVDLVNLAATGCGYVNKFRNATMDVWQRGTSLSTGGGYTADGWIVSPTGAAVTASQVAGRLLSAYALRVTGAASVTDVLVYQRIESVVAAPLSGQTVTVQAQIYNNTGTTITPTLTVTHPASADAWGGSQITDVNAANLQACPNGAWTRVAYTFVASTATVNGIQVIFDFGNNLSSNSKFVQLAELDTRVTPFAPVGLNAVPPPPELRPVTHELQFCQRYFQKSYSQSVAPGANLGNGGGTVYNVAAPTNYVGGAVRYQTVMRTAAQMTAYDNAGTPNKISYLVTTTGSWSGGGALTQVIQFDSGFSWLWGPVNNTGNVSFDWVASAEL
ncbi:hypothetical protein JQ557_15585 [Bradyrhizobium sp. U87765 SZCCT0131]|uniref:hypothetical protein n=1 Tax=unclassified Bradyrhizobium TaxID=2631580 RepID=UPI001BAB2F34|nr:MULTISPECIES: hypothetical protein [unclassified Bradyrhizobium]MBR1219425.1 hypothetical protein [Bradyrhizobium sp. U87765 SZCCT0131]MBR1262076.1 hypothetical protein [Bradyrhizobium sp. U87765 SZCCT0134]MBR1306071.1 hypothetical protein [Bradyrhizobium sp. U87765 SZCCT0110]MBR1317858.1 hypothetical protein [Bradyrhizobium sp. U87765 SZCCT0109]MBR1351560.1 hypothetical protein [Bradyrhizobium sp. U87765 SZCCT0048]